MFIFFLAGLLDVSECEDRFKLKRQPGVIFADRADASGRRLGRRGREQLNVGTSATGHGLHLSARETGLTETYSGESLEDGADRGEGGRHRVRSMHASLDQAKYFWGAEWSHGRVQGYITPY